SNLSGPVRACKDYGLPPVIPGAALWACETIQDAGEYFTCCRKRNGSQRVRFMKSLCQSRWANSRSPCRTVRLCMSVTKLMLLELNSSAICKDSIVRYWVLTEPARGLCAKMRDL